MKPFHDNPDAEEVSRLEPTPHRAQMTDDEIRAEIDKDLDRAGRYMAAFDAVGAPLSPGVFSYVTGREPF